MYRHTNTIGGYVYRKVSTNTLNILLECQTYELFTTHSDFSIMITDTLTHPSPLIFRLCELLIALNYCICILLLLVTFMLWYHNSHSNHNKIFITYFIDLFHEDYNHIFMLNIVRQEVV